MAARLSLVMLSLAALACASIGLGLGTAASAPPTAAGESGELAFVGADRNLYVLDPSTGDKTALTDDATLNPGGASVVYGAPTWAPQTGQLAFTRTRIAADGAQHVDLMVSSGRPGPGESVFSDASRTPFYIYWSPDGETLSFLASAADGSLGAYIRRPGEGAQLLDEGQPYYWVWSPDGASLLAHVGGSAGDNPSGARLSLFQGQPLEGRRLDLPPADFQAPDMAPDGRRVLVAGRQPNGTVALNTVDVSGGSVAELAVLDGPVGFGWSASGNSIAFITLPGVAPDTFGSLGWVDMSQPGRPKMIPGVASHVASFFWSPSGDRLAYLVPEVVTPGNQQQVANRQQSGELVLNLYVADANSSTATKVASYTPTDDFLSLMPFFDQYERSISLWSPDGSQLVYTASTKNEPPGVYVVQADGSRPGRRVADGSLAIWSWR
jgi:Tol biopolymer transport system component